MQTINSGARADISLESVMGKMRSRKLCGAAKFNFESSHEVGKCS